MIDCFYFPYTLKIQHSDRFRRGMLLKCHFKGGKIGYADCHPWVEAGDESLDFHLEKLKEGELTPLLEGAFRIAAIDAEARKNHLSLKPQEGVLKSHFLCTNLLELTEEKLLGVLKEGFTHIKLKLGRQLKQETAKLLELFSDSPLKIRLDFNSSLDRSTFEGFLEEVELLKSQIDFIEDPFFFNSASWSAIQEKGWTLAADRCLEEAIGNEKAARVLIWKPALFPSFSQTSQQVIVTTYVGHPLEQISAAYFASKIDLEGERVHGLLSHRLFALNPFSAFLNWKGPSFSFSGGEGFGFGAMLEGLAWK